MTKEEHYLAGMERFSDDDLDGAIDNLQLALEIDPDYGDALHAVAMSYYHKGDLDRAVEFGERLRTAEPENVHAYTSLSMFYNAKGFIDKAEEMGALASRYGDGT